MDFYVFIYYEFFSCQPNSLHWKLAVFKCFFRISYVYHYFCFCFWYLLKVYFFDVGLVKGDDGAKFENLVALCLQKAVFAKVDYQAKPFTLKYLHTKQKHEVDFALVEDQQIKQMIEVKVSDASLSQSLCYFHEKYNIPAVQVVKNLKKERMESGIAIRRADPFLAELDL